MFWVTLVRGTMAITLGLALFLQPDMTRPFLTSFMGMFWLVSGAMSIRWGLSGERSRGLPILSGVVAIVAGIVAQSRRFRPLAGYVSEGLVISVLGAAILLTGIMHMIGGFRTGDDVTRQWSRTSFLLGFFEFIMGVMLVLEPLQQGTLIYLGSSIWAMIGGSILIGDALRLRSAARKADIGRESQ